MNLWQRDEKGEDFWLPSVWTLLLEDKNRSEVMAQNNLNPKEVEEKGLFHCLREKGVSFLPTRQVQKASANALTIHKELLERQNRHDMQTKAEQGHSGEPPWTCEDQHGEEVISSVCAVVGFFIFYGVLAKKLPTMTTTSRKTQAEHNVKWNIVPPLCRLDNLEEKNAALQAMREESASSSALPPPDIGAAEPDPLQEEEIVDEKADEDFQD